jgi:predicted NAD/FAD-dependent oxidoreductase
MSTHRIAIIGAGLAGLAAARRLVDAGYEVRLFEKSGAPGGRAATRRRGAGSFDHGAQYATFRDPRGRAVLEAARAAGVLAPWTARIGVLAPEGIRACPPDTERFVGVPDMRALSEWMADGLVVRYDSTVRALTPDALTPDALTPDALTPDALTPDALTPDALTPDAARGSARRWSLTLDGGTTAGGFDVVLLAVPAPQARTLLATAAEAGVRVDALAAVVDAVPMTPCLAALLTVPQRPAWPWDAAFVHDDAVLAWVARNASKPRRDGAECWVLHATTAWSIAHLEAEPETLVPHFAAAWARLLLPDAVAPTSIAVHRWRYARPADGVSSGDEAHLDATIGLGVAGDWCVGGRIEGALLSGRMLAERVLATR